MEHRNRLARLGFEQLDAQSWAQGRPIIGADRVSAPMIWCETSEALAPTGARSYRRRLNGLGR